MFVQVLLISAIAILVFFFLRKRNNMRYQAGKKILLGILAVASVVAVVDPDSLTRVANLIGVGRGTDLLLYGLVVAFFFVSLNTYLKFRDQETRLVRIARRLALDEAIATDLSAAPADDEESAPTQGR
jgi:hypothetical protein